MIEIIEILKEKINNERTVMINYYLEMSVAHEKNQADKAGVLASMVYASKSIIDDLKEQIIELKGE